ncbi:hypothetical protein A1Q2_00203 [Trichosporon asahii var. asahii CBS 8904]|uniref:F-box domain-containing protein n=2 Tax=Trichosporon asahii var. asahii TaxID=189963 RepID=K1W0U5_TRIAC|nr:hypothetical protein A1Q1_03261 [Trichosporon asahii var. asahii CBS 2479]EJT47800.1 hypothetical protein A1Q1_03261 [Trichosporon asahii var. asahii CBS 2479]EKD05442.1 hypothetical protein A1Q2_00203 [Trichosporon asahii var. asahii CBS 8904]
MRALTFEVCPDLVDTLIRLSSHDTQLRLRLVSKSYRNAIDREHLRHIVLTPYGDGARVRGPTRAIAALNKLGPGSWSQLPEHPLRALGQHVRIIDVRGFFPATTNLALLRDAFPNLTMFRLTTMDGSYTPYVPFEAETMVVFTSPDGGVPNPKPYVPGLDDDYDDYDEEPVIPANVPRMSERITKIIVNMSGDDYPVADMFRCVLDPPPHIKDIIIFIPRYITDTFVFPDGSKGHRAGLMGHTTCVENIIAMDLAELMIGVPHVRYTLIGAEDIPWPKERFRRLVRTHLSGFGYGEVEYGDDSPTTECSIETGRKIVLPKNPKTRTKHLAKVDEELSKLTLLNLDEYIGIHGLERTMQETLEYSGELEREPRRGIVPGDLRRMGPAGKNPPVSFTDQMVRADDAEGDLA